MRGRTTGVRNAPPHQKTANADPVKRIRASLARYLVIERGPRKRQDRERAFCQGSTRGRDGAARGRVQESASPGEHRPRRQATGAPTGTRAGACWTTHILVV